MINSRRIAIRQKLEMSLKRHNLNINPQAMSALVETLYNCDPEYLGHTDTLLAGLLMCGSYTVDVLDQAGLNLDRLKQLTLDTALGPHEWDHNDKRDPINLLFKESPEGEEFLEKIKNRDRIIETADILRLCLRPTLGGNSIDYNDFLSILACRKDTPAESSLLRELEESVLQTIIIVVDSYLLKSSKLLKILKQRKQPITKEEDWILDKNLGAHYKGMTIPELDWIISALNAWFVNKQILTTPTTICLKVVDRISSLLYAPSHFTQSGGDLAKVEIGLDIAKRFVPDRDFPVMALFLRENRIFAEHFSYRDLVHTTPSNVVNIEHVRGVQIFAPKPIPLIDLETINKFEEIISTKYVSENLIQNFLANNPELLLSLGYAKAQPHVCLRQPGSDNLIPDFILEIPGGRGFDILDLKLPSARLTATNPYLRISSELTKAVAQLRMYAKFFEKPENREQFEKLYGLTAFKPEVIVVIGRRSQLHQREERIEIEEQLGKVRLYTYDDLLEYAKRYTIELPFRY